VSTRVCDQPRDGVDILVARDDALDVRALDEVDQGGRVVDRPSLVPVDELVRDSDLVGVDRDRRVELAVATRDTPDIDRAALERLRPAVLDDVRDLGFDTAERSAPER